VTNDKDQSIAKLLHDSQDMVRRFEALTGKNRVEQISSDAQRHILEELEDALEPSVDGFFDLFVEDDVLSAVAEFRPPAGGGKPLDMGQIEAVLEKHAIVHGVLWDAVHFGLDQCNLERKFVSDLVVAQGTQPLARVPAHWRIDSRWTESPAPTADDAQIDFKQFSPFVMVKQGELIALRMPEVPGTPGTDLLGNELPFTTEAMVEWTPGDNVHETTLGFEAALDGRLVLTASAFGVNPVLELKEGVDYRTGNVHFRGEVRVVGRVAAGFSIEAGGGLSCTEVLDAYDVKVGTDLATPGGIIGNGLGRIEVGGRVDAKFLEHLYLLAQDDVVVEVCVLNSVVKTRGRLVLGERGIVAGGQIHTLNGIELFQVGTPTGPNTELFVGLDYQGMEHIVWLRERTRELQEQLKKVDAATPYGGNRTADLVAAAKKLRAEIVQLTDTARTQLMQLGQNDEAALTVHGSVYPGTTIEICHMRFVVTQKLSAVRFSLDKRKGIVAVQSLTPTDGKGATGSGAPQKKR
jgi:hypothetical protein